MYLEAAGAISAGIWLYLLFARGGFWNERPYAECSAAPTDHLQIVAVIPARDEAAVIADAVASLLKQNFLGQLKIVLVDDSSTDGTADLARAAAHRLGKDHQLTIVPGLPLPSGWTGKLWALSQGVAAANAFHPHYLLLTDADILHDPHNVSQLASLAETQTLDLVSFMVKLHVADFAERALIPAFVYFFLQLYPPAWIRNPHRQTAGAAGGCVLIRRQALERIGGLASIGSEIIDDCALARRVKRSGAHIWLGLTSAARSIRPYEGFAGIGRMISRTAFNQLDHSVWILVATLAGLLLTYVVPLLLLFSGRPMAILIGALAYLLMTVTYLPMVRFYRLPWIWSAALPLVAIFYTAATIHSAVRYWQGAGGEWKGRVQDVKSL